MRRIFSVACWAFCASLLTISNPLASQKTSDAQAQPRIGSKTRKADKKKKKRSAKTVRKCVNFTQTLGSDEESVDLQLTNSCKFEVECTVQWELQCSSERGAQVADESSKATTLEQSQSWDLRASTDACEVDWEIKNVSWQCVAREG